MELTYLECINIISVLNDINGVRDQSGKVIKEAPVFPSKFSIRMADLEDEIRPKLKNYYKVQEHLFKKLGELSQVEGFKDAYHIKPENMEEFTKEHDILLQEKVQINYQPLPEDTFDNVQVSKDFIKFLKPVRK